MVRITSATALLLASACVSTESRLEFATARDLDDHLAGFAMAHCLRSLGGKGLPEPDVQVMQQQGDRWIQIVVERSYGDIEQFFAIGPAINAAVAATPMAIVKDEASQAGSSPAPVFYCAQIIRQPAVTRGIAAARAALAPAYTKPASER